MTPLPKRKTSQARKGRRRSHDALAKVRLVECPSCHAPRLPHHICPHCGSYRGMDVINVKAEE